MICWVLFFNNKVPPAKQWKFCGEIFVSPIVLKKPCIPHPTPLKFSLTLHQRSRYLANFNIKNCFYCFSVLMVWAHYPLWLKDNVYLLLLKKFLVLPPWFPCQLPFWNFMLNKTWYSTKAKRQTRLRACQLNSTVSREDPNRPSLMKVRTAFPLSYVFILPTFRCLEIVERPPYLLFQLKKEAFLYIGRL